MSQLSALCEKHGIRLESKCVGESRDGDWVRRDWRCTLRFRRKQLTVRFYTGMLAGEPSVADVLSCLFSDAQVGGESFECFCATFGYDTDSRKALATWEACRATGPKLDRLFAGAETWRAIGLLLGALAWILASNFPS